MTKSLAKTASKMAVETDDVNISIQQLLQTELEKEEVCVSKIEKVSTFVKGFRLTFYREIEIVFRISVSIELLFKE